MEYKELGLTSNESKTYEIILKLKKSGASEISRSSGVPYGRIYTVLESLEEKNLIKCIAGEKKQYAASDPENLHTIIDTRIKKLMEIDSQIKELKKIYEDKNEEKILLFKGRKNLHKALEETKAPKEYKYLILYKYDTNPEILREIKDTIKSKVELKILGRIDNETSPNVKEFKTINKEIKPIKNEGVTLEIVDDTEVMINLIKSDTALFIKDEAFAKIMKQLFIKYYMNTDYEKE
jgi:sugar-specific transcriptional regulator TrmB